MSAHRERSVPCVATCDVSDAMGLAALVVPIAFRDYGGRLDFSGPAYKLQTNNDNSKIRTAFELNGDGRVLVIDNCGAMNCAMVGGNLAALAARNGWAGILVYGCIRDSHEVLAEDIGIKALGTCPVKTKKLGVGAFDVSVTFGSVTISSGDWVTADADGVVVTKENPKT